MAAVICTAPFTLCNSICKGCGQACSFITKPIAKCGKSPFCCFVTMATIFNIPPIVMAASVMPSIATGGLSCKGVTWLLADMCLCVCNLLGAWYLAVKVGGHSRRLETEEMEKERTALGRAKQVICYDPWFALYLLLLVGFIVWQGMGSKLVATGFESNSCPQNVEKAMTTAIAFGWAFIIPGFAAFFCSICCAACDGSDYGDMPVYVTPEQRAQQAQQKQEEQQVATATDAARAEMPQPAPYAVQTGTSSMTKPTKNFSGDQDEIPIATAVIQTDDKVTSAPPVTASSSNYAGASAPPPSGENENARGLSDVQAQATEYFNSVSETMGNMFSGWGKK